MWVGGGTAVFTAVGGGTILVGGGTAMLGGGTEVSVGRGRAAAFVAGRTAGALAAAGVADGATSAAGADERATAVGTGSEGGGTSYFLLAAYCAYWCLRCGYTVAVAIVDCPVGGGTAT